MDARALGWAHDHADKWITEGQESGTLSGIAYNQPPYSERYPKLINILRDKPKAPRGNLITRNVCVGGRWDEVTAPAKPFTQFKDNLIDSNPGLVSADAGNFQLRDDSPAWKRGFQRIPIENIGLVKDNYRTSLPPLE